MSTFQKLCILAGLMSLVCNSAAAQNPNDKNRDKNQNEEELSSKDVRVMRFSADGAVESKRLPAKGESSATRKTGAGRGENGSYVFKDLNGRRQIEISVDDRNRIRMEIEMSYSSNDAGLLTQRFPQLKDYIDLFPKNIGDEEIELNFKVRSVHTADDVDDLKKKDRKAFGIYKRYQDQVESKKAADRRRKK